MDSDEESPIAGEINVEILKFKWEVNVDTFTDKKVGDELRSPKFFTKSTAGDLHDKWELVLNPQGDVKLNKNYISLFLTCLSDTAVNVTYSLSILNQDNVKVVNKICENQLFDNENDNESWGYRRFAKKSFIEDPKNNILKDNKLTIWCEIGLKKPGVEENEKNQNKKNALRANEFDRFEKLLTSGVMSDVIIQAEGKNYHLHKCILITCSDVFDAMFRNDMKEKHQNLVEIKDIKKCILDEFFQFIYTGKVNEIEKIVCELFIAAEKYCVYSLQDFCIETMCVNVNKDNALQYLNLEITYNVEKIKSDIIYWISHNTKYFTENPEFDNFGKQHPEVLLEIIRSISDNKRDN